MKQIVSIYDYRELFEELRHLRRLRLSRKDKIPFHIHRRRGRKKLEEFVKQFWTGGYVYLESGDYLYIPPMMEIDILWRLIEPYVPDPIIGKFCQPGYRVMDIGANIGEWTLQMARKVGPAGRVYSFEPLPFMHQSLHKTLHINNLSQVYVSPFALSDRLGESPFTIPYDRENRAISGESRLGSGKKDWNIKTDVASTKTINIKTVTLDHFVAENKIDKLDFVKIDVEGNERRVLEGGQDTFSRFKPALVLEAGCEEEDDRKKISGLLRSRGYEIMGVILPHGIVEVGWNQYTLMDHPFIQRYPSNVLFLSDKNGIR